MFTAYLYKTEDLESACNQFLKENFEEDYVDDILEKFNSVELVKDYLLKKECLNGEILSEDGRIAILIEKFMDGFDIKDINFKNNQNVITQ